MNDVNLYQFAGVWAAAFSLNFMLAIVQDLGRRTLQTVVARHSKLLDDYPNVKEPDLYYRLQAARTHIDNCVRYGSFGLYSTVILVCAFSLGLIIYSSYFQDAKISWLCSLALIFVFFIVPPSFLIFFSLWLRRRTRAYENLRTSYATLMERSGAHKDGTISLKRYADETFQRIHFETGGSQLRKFIRRWFFGEETVAVDAEMLAQLERLNKLTGETYEDITSNALAFMHMISEMAQEAPDSLLVMKAPDGTETKYPVSEVFERIKRGDNPFQ